MKFKAHFVQKLKMYKRNLVLVIDNKIMFFWAWLAKLRYRLIMTTQYFKYDNTIIDIPEHQYYKIKQSRKKSLFISCIHYVEGKIVV